VGATVFKAKFRIMHRYSVQDLKPVVPAGQAAGT
jgi:hypothetical protein